MTDQELHQKDFIGILESLERGEISSGQAAEKLLIEEDCHAKVRAIRFKQWCDKYEASIANFHEEFFTAEQLYDKFKEDTQ